MAAAENLHAQDHGIAPGSKPIQSIAFRTGFPRGLHRIWIVLAVVCGISLVAFSLLRDTARERTMGEADAALARARITVDNWLEQYRPYPALYARDPRVVEALAGDPAPGSLDDISRELASWNGISGASVTYLLDGNGTAVAASNWQESDSFVGETYDFRPYFTEAIAGRETGFFGLGTVSNLRGYFLSAPVDVGGRIRGVVVVKISVAALEEALDLGPHTAFMTDRAGVAIISGNGAIRMTRLSDIARDEQREIVRTRAYALSGIDLAPLQDLGAWRDGPRLVEAPQSDAPAITGTYLRRAQALPVAGWTLHLIYDLGPYRGHLRSIGTAILASAVACLAIAMLGLQRRQILIDRLADRERDRAELARRIRGRTGELTEANARLEREVAERRAAEDTLRQTQNELVQAGKLAALGQMSAALSHEFNQPLTAIRTYTENAEAFFEAGQSDRAAQNLARVLRLTEKVAQLSKHLTRFARRSDGDVAPVRLDAVIDEALGLLEARIRKSGATIRVTGLREATVLGGATRLQHVLMNLVSNAIDAARPGVPPDVVLRIDRVGNRIEIVIEDNGTGITPDTLPQVFDPFFTTKEVGQGLGLGLSICFNIVRDFGGVLRAETRPEGGARMTVVLRAADGARLAAE